MPLHCIEETQKVSSKFGKQILQPLEKHGLVRGQRGRQGGYLLQVEPEKISILDVFKAMGEEIILAPCLGKKGLCFREDRCGAREVWGNLEGILIDYFRKITINDLIEKEKIK